MILIIAAARIWSSYHSWAKLIDFGQWESVTMPWRNVLPAIGLLSTRTMFVFDCLFHSLKIMWRVCDVMFDVMCVMPFRSDVFHDASLLCKNSVNQQHWSFYVMYLTLTMPKQTANIIQKKEFKFQRSTRLLVKFVALSCWFFFKKKTIFILPSLNWSLIGKINCCPPALTDAESSEGWLWNTVRWKVADRFS